jgi:hypothetical protein
MAGLQMPELPRAVPIFTRGIEGCYLIGLQFETPAEAQKFADGLAKHLSISDADIRQLIFKGSGLPLTQGGSGIN